MDKIDEFLKSLLNKSKADTGFSQKKEHVCPSEEIIACYFDNLLSDTEREKVEEHLARCENCLQQTVLLQSLRKETKENGCIETPTEIIERAKDIIPESSKKSLIEVILKYSKTLSGLKTRWSLSWRIH